MFRYFRIPMTLLSFAVLAGVTAGAASANQSYDSYHRHDRDYPDHHQRQDGWYDNNGHFHYRSRNSYSWYRCS